MISRFFQNATQRPRFWLGMALVLPLYFSLISAWYGWSGGDRLQDDARQHIVWLLRLADPNLFPQSWIADYYQAQSPPAFQALYWLAAQVGLDALVWVKVLPILLGLVATGYFFGVAYQLLPNPLVAFIATLMFNQNIWLKEDVMSGTPRAMVYPIFAAFLYYLLRGQVGLTLLTIALQGLFYPTLVLIEVGVLTLRLIDWSQGRLQWQAAKSIWGLWGAGVAIAAVILIPLAIGDSPYSPIVSLEQMKTMPEFQLGGRAEYFGMSPLRFWTAGRSGIRMPLYPPLIWLGFLLPLVRYGRLPLAQAITPKIRILVDILLPSIAWYILAHLLMVQLYLPSRYLYHSLRFIMTLAAGLTLAILLDAGWRWWQQQRSQGLSLTQWGLSSLVLLLLSAAIVVPALPPVFVGAHHWVDGKYPDLYEFVAQTPPTTMIASLSEEADNLPAFARRSVLVGREFALPYQLGYYLPLRATIMALIQAQYSPDLADLKTFIQTYQPQLWLLDNWAFSADYLRQNNRGWLRQYSPVVDEAIARLEEGQTPAIQQTFTACTVFVSDRYRLLDTNCLANFNPAPSG